MLYDSCFMICFDLQKVQACKLRAQDNMSSLSIQHLGLERAIWTHLTGQVVNGEQIRPGSLPQGMMHLGLQYTMTQELGDPSVPHRPQGLLLPYWSGLMIPQGRCAWV